MPFPALKRFAFVALAVGLAAAAFAAKAPKDSGDLINFLDPLWGKSAAEFPRAAKLKTGDYTPGDSPAGSDRKVILPTAAAKARWTPKSLAAQILSFEFDPKLGLIEVSGFLPKGTVADFDALVKEMNARYGQYATHTSAMDMHTYGWVFPKATLSVSSNGGEPQLFRIQVNP